jgi:hypothetical protein
MIREVNGKICSNEYRQKHRIRRGRHHLVSSRLVLSRRHIYDRKLIFIIEFEFKNNIFTYKLKQMLYGDNERSDRPGLGEEERARGRSRFGFVGFFIISVPQFVAHYPYLLLVMMMTMMTGVLPDAIVTAIDDWCIAQAGRPH